MSQKSSRILIATSTMLILSVLIVTQSPAALTLKSIYAYGSPDVVITPFFQLPGGTVTVNAQGLTPNANATIFVKNVVAKVVTQTQDGVKMVTFPDVIVAGRTETNADGSLEWALGVPKDDVKIIERWVDNATGRVIKTITTDYRFQGTVKVQVTDEFGKSATGELTVIRWITESPFR
jgi:hypothetical protein